MIKLTRWRLALLPALLTLAVCFVDAATDIYIATLPMIVSELATSEEGIKLTLSLYFLALCLSIPIYGTLAEVWGRRPLLVGGMGIFCFFSYLCSLCTNVSALIICRFFQGFGGGAALVLSLVIIKDTFSAERSAPIVGAMHMVMAAIPAIIPVLGGYLGVLYGWRMNFYVLGGGSLGVFMALVMLMPETLPSGSARSLSLYRIVKDYAYLLNNPYFIIYVLTSSLVFSGFWVYISSASFFFVEKCGVSIEHYSYYPLCSIACSICGTYMNRRLLRKHTLNYLLSLGVSISFAGGVALAMVSLILPYSTWSLTAAMGIYAWGMGMIFANATVLALNVSKNLAGPSSALLGMSEMMCSSCAIVLSGGGWFKNSFIFPSVCILILSIINLSLCVRLKKLPKNTI